MPRKKKEEPPVPAEPVKDAPDGREVAGALLKNSDLIWVEGQRDLSPVFGHDPIQVVETARRVAGALVPILIEQKLFKVINGRKFVYVDGWTTMTAMLGVFPHVVWSRRVPHEDACIYESRVEMRTVHGHVISAGEAMCSSREENWADREEFQIRSMAETRAVGKACRVGFAWILKLAGYEGTPAEEMDGINPEPAPDRTKPPPPPPPAPPKAEEPEPKKDPGKETVKKRTADRQKAAAGRKKGTEDPKTWLPPMPWINFFDEALKLVPMETKDATLTWLHTPDHRKPVEWARAAFKLAERFAGNKDFPELPESMIDTLKEAQT
jgi:hypothetical protein